MNSQLTMFTIEKNIPRSERKAGGGAPNQAATWAKGPKSGPYR